MPLRKHVECRGEEACKLLKMLGTGSPTVVRGLFPIPIWNAAGHCGILQELSPPAGTIYLPERKNRESEVSTSRLLSLAEKGKAG